MGDRSALPINATFQPACESSVEKGIHLLCRFADFFLAWFAAEFKSQESHRRRPFRRPRPACDRRCDCSLAIDTNNLSIASNSLEGSLLSRGLQIHAVHFHAGAEQRGVLQPTGGHPSVVAGFTNACRASLRDLPGGSERLICPADSNVIGCHVPAARLLQHWRQTNCR
jgi:hypothetical protein